MEDSPDSFGAKRASVAAGPVDLRLLTAGDLEAVTDIHLTAFPDAAMTALGREAVRRQYTWYLEGPHDAICMGGWLEGRLAGFCFSGLFRGATGGFLRKNRPYLIRRVLLRPWLLWNPLFRGRAVTALRILNPFRRRQVAPADAPWWNTYGILAIAVDPRLQGAGVGRALMGYADSAARERGVPRMVLTVSRTNERAIRFYENLGWNRSLEKEVWDGTMTKDLGSASAITTESVSRHD